MQLKLLTSLVLCSVLRVGAVINQQHNEVDRKPDFKDVFSSLFGFKTTFLGAKRNHVNKKLDRVSGFGNLFGSLGPTSSTGEGDSYASGHSSGGHADGYSYEKPAPVYGAPAQHVDTGYHYERPAVPAPIYGAPQQVDTGYHYEQPAVPAPIYGAPQPSYGLPEAPKSSYGVPVAPSNSYLPSAPHSSYETPSEHQRPPTLGSGFAGVTSHGSSSNSFQGLGSLKDLTSIGSLGGHGKSSRGQSKGLGGIGGFGNIFSSIGQLPQQAIGAKKSAVNSVFDGKISLLERFAQLANRGSNSQSDSYSPANSESHPYA